MRLFAHSPIRRFAAAPPGSWILAPGSSSFHFFHNFFGPENSRSAHFLCWNSEFSSNAIVQTCSEAVYSAESLIRGGSGLYFIWKPRRVRWIRIHQCTRSGQNAAKKVKCIVHQVLINL